MSTNCLKKISELISIFDVPLDKLSEWVDACYSDYPLQSIKQIRKLSNNPHHNVMNEVIASNVIPQIIKLLKHNNYTVQMLCCGYIRELNLQYQIPHEIINYIASICVMDCSTDDRLQAECRWILLNITSGTSQQTKYIVDNGAIPLLIDGMKQNASISVKIHSIWALGNIAADCTKYRDLVLSHDVFTHILPLCDTTYNTEQQLSLLRNVAWTVSNLCRGRPAPERGYVESAIKVLMIMMTSKDKLILQDLCWALSYLSINEEYHILLIVENGLLSRLIECLGNDDPDVCHPALRAIGNIVTGNDQHTQMVINMGSLKKLYNLLQQHNRADIKREACWTVSNITAGSRHQIESVINANLIHPLLGILSTEKYEIAQEALWATSNATSGGSDVQIAFLVNQGVIEAVCKFCKTMNERMHSKITMVALEGIENILDAGKRIYGLNECGENKFAQYFETNGGVDFLKQLQSNQSIPDDVYDKVYYIIRRHFDR